jgi:3-keto steroid reductase
LTIIPTARSQAKADDTVLRLNKHLEVYCRKAERNTSGAGALNRRRVTIEPELLDLCNILSLKRGAKSLRSKYARLDALVFNAGVGGWTGVDWGGLVKQLVTEGMNFIKAPAYKMTDLGMVVGKQVVPGKLIDPVPGASLPQEEEPPLGGVFCANVFGHYLLSHYLAPLLSESTGRAGRIIWVSTLEAWAKTFDVDDFQGLANPLAYESSKRLTDILVMSAELEGTAVYTKACFSSSAAPSLGSSWDTSSFADTPTRSLRSSTRLKSTPTKNDTKQITSQEEPKQKPKMYLSHPGICVTSIMPLHWLLVYGYVFALYLARCCGSPWHTTSPYSGATSMAWLALADFETLDEMEGKSKCKWGSAVNWLGKERVKKTVVEGWVDENGEPAKEKERRSFEELGRRCWGEMEGLRKEWEELLGDEDR